MKKIKQKMLSMLLGASIISGLVPTTTLISYANNNVPVISDVENKGNSAQVYWGVDMLDSNVLMKIGFESGETVVPNLKAWNGIPGEQSIVNEGYNSQKAFQVLPTGPDKGNYYSYPATSSNRSITSFGRIYGIPNGAKLSVTAKVKAEGQSKVSFLGDGAWSTVKYDISSVVLTKDYQAGDEWVYLSDTKAFPKQGSTSYFLTPDPANQHGSVLTVAEKTDFAIKLRSPIKANFKAGTNLVVRYWAGSASLPQASISNTNGWQPVSINGNVDGRKFNGEWVVDSAKKGISMLVLSTVQDNSRLLIDDIKFGYATKSNVYRDGQKLPLTEDQKYLSQYIDTGATDKTAPDNPQNISFVKNGDNIRISWGVTTDKGNTYSYQITSEDNSGVESPKSQPRSVQVTSGVSKYRVKKGNVILGETANTYIDILPADLADISIVAIDGAGNVSNPGTLVNDTQPPTINAKLSVSQDTNKDVTIQIRCDDNVGVKEIVLPNGKVVAGASTDFVVTQNGTYTFVVKDFRNNTTTTTVEISNIDKEKPGATHSLSTTAWTNEDVTITVKATDPATTYAMKRIKLPNGSYVTGTTATVIVKENGTYNFGIEDMAGNIVDYPVTISNIDKSKPQVVYELSTIGETNQNVLIRLTAKDEGSGIDQIKLPNGDFVLGGVAEIEVAQNGNYAFEASDKVGNKTLYSVNVSNIDKVNPVASHLLSTTDWTNEDVTISVTAEDPISTYTMKQIRLPNGQYANANKVDYSVDTNGTYVFGIEDTAGNIVEYPIIISNIDKVAPTSPGVEETNKKFLLIPSVDEGSGVKEYKYSFSGAEWITWTGDLDLSQVEDGYYNIKIKAIDNAGNVSSEYIKDFRITYAIQEADKAMDKAENTLLQEDLDIAEELVNELASSEEKQSLIDRLDKAQVVIKEKEITDKLKQIEEGLSLENLTQEEFEEILGELEDLKDKISNLPDSSNKGEIGNSLDKVEKDQQDKEVSLAKKTNAEYYVRLAEGHMRAPYIDKARELVASLPASAYKGSLQTRLGLLDVKLSKDDDKSIKAVEQAIARAEKYKREQYFKQAEKLIGTLKEQQNREKYTEILSQIKNK